MKKVKLLGLLFTSLFSLTACGGYEYPNFGNLKDGEKYEIGILLPVTHDALNKAKDGFIDGLKSKGFESGKNLNINIKNAEGNADDQRTMAKSLINTCVLTLGIGTGASQDLVAAQKSKGSKNPIMFTAVTDPVDAQLVSSMDQPGGLVTGSSDKTPDDILSAQLQLIKQFIPTVDKVGIFFTNSETNSEAQALLVKDWLNKEHITPVVKTCTNATDVGSAATALAEEQGLDAIFIPTDNNVAANMNYVKAAVRGKQILVICGESSLVTSGGHLSISLSYTTLGFKTGEMAAKILSGEKKPDQLPVYSVPANECDKYVSINNLQDAGFSFTAADFTGFTNLD